MLISGIHSFDMGTVSSFIPQKSDEFQVRNSFVQTCEKKKKQLFKYEPGWWVWKTERSMKVNFTSNDGVDLNISDENRPLMFVNAIKFLDTFTKHNHFLPFGSRCDLWQFDSSHPADNQQHYCEYSSGNVIKLSTHVFLDSKMNWVDFGSQLVRGCYDLTTHIFGHNSNSYKLFMTKIHTNVY